MLFFILPLIALALIVMPLVPVYTGVATGKKARRAFIFNICGFVGVMLLAVILPLGGFVSAATEAGSAAAAMSTGEGLKYLGAAISTGLGCIGAGLGVGTSASAAIGACSEDPKAFGKSMIFVVMGEGIAIYGLVISFMILFAV